MLTEAEHEELRERAHRERTSMSALLRESLFGGTPIPENPPENKGPSPVKGNGHGEKLATARDALEGWEKLQAAKAARRKG
jgi:hypothetical protein